MSIVFCLVFLLCFSQVGSASFSAQMDLVKPSVSFTVRGDKESWFRGFSVDADEKSQKWQTTFRIKETGDFGTNSLDFGTAAWQKDQELGADFSFVWQSGHATLQGKKTLSRNGSKWSPKIIVDFQPYFDAKVQYEQLTQGGKWQVTYRKKTGDLTFSSSFSYYKEPTCSLSCTYDPGPADLSFSLGFGKGGVTKTAARIGFDQERVKGFLKVDVDRYTKGTVALQLDIDKLKIDAKVQDAGIDVGLSCAISSGDFTFQPSLSFGSKGLGLGFRIKIA